MWRRFGSFGLPESSSKWYRSELRCINSSPWTKLFHRFHQLHPKINSNVRSCKHHNNDHTNVHHPYLQIPSMSLHCDMYGMGLLFIPGVATVSSNPGGGTMASSVFRARSLDSALRDGAGAITGPCMAPAICSDQDQLQLAIIRKQWNETANCFQFMLGLNGCKWKETLQ